MADASPLALSMGRLQRVREDHRDAILAFELENRGYFAAAVADRGDEYFARFAERHDELLAEQAAGDCAFYVLVDPEGRVLGRFNLYDLADGTADVGYRVAERVAGTGVATAALEELCVLAAEEHGLRVLRAKVADRNVASRRVLEKAGFARVGEADVAGQPGSCFQRVLGRIPYEG